MNSELKIDSLTKSRDSHNSHIAILPLLLWENETISNHLIQKSSAPRHISEYCCALGSISAGGNTFPSPLCEGRRSTYDRVHQRVRELLPEDGYGCDTCRILDIIIEKNLTLSFWGDSVHHQAFDGFVCEMYRRNYTIISTKTQEMPNPTMETIREIITVTVASPSWRQHQENRQATIKFFAQYRPKFTVEEIYRESIVPLLEGGTDILFFNFGLHWPFTSARKEYQYLMFTAMTALKQHAVRKISLFAFRETTAQHFDTPLGEWPAVSMPIYKCTPLNETKKQDPLLAWRNHDILDAVNKSGFTFVSVDPSGKIPMPPLLLQSDKDEIAMLPFTEFTSDFHDLHPNECTHYCSTPHLWIPLWRSLRLSMDRRFS